MVALSTQSQLEHSIEDDNVGAIDSEEGRGRKMRLNLLQRFNRPVEGLPRPSNKAIIAFGFEAEDLINVEESDPPGSLLIRNRIHLTSGPDMHVQACVTSGSPPLASSMISSVPWHSRSLRLFKFLREISGR